MGHDAGQWLAAELYGRAGAHHHQGGRAVVDTGAAGGGDGAVFLEGRLERRDFVELDAARALVGGYQHLAAATFDRHRGDLGGKCATLDRRLGPLHAGSGKGVLLGAGEAVLGGAVLAKGAHGATALVGVFQAVEHQVVKNAVVPDAVAPARLGQQVGRVGHALHAAGHQHVGAAGQQHVMRQHGCAHPRAAHLAQRDGAGTVGQASFESGLARRRLTLACHQAVAHQHLVHLPRRHAGALHRSGNGRAAQVVCRQRRKIALKTTHGGAGCCHDHDRFRHQISFLIFAGGALASACQP